MPLFEAFVGGTYQALNATTAADVCVNLYQETRREGVSAKQRWLLGTPGRKPFLSTATAAHRGSFTQDGITVSVFGGTVYTLDPGTRVLTALGSIADDGAPVSIASNGLGGDEIAVCGGGQLKIINRVTLALSAAITLPFSNPVQLAFMDGYFLLNQRDTPTVWFSGIEDGTSWDALDFIGRSGTSDNIIGIGVSQDRLWLFGSQTTSQFYDSGDADTPFLPYPGTASQMGAVTPWAIWLRNDIFTWLAQDSAGQLKVAMASGSTSPKVISTPPIEQWLARCPSMTGAECLGYQQDGHAFFALTCPLSPDEVKTYVWDDTESMWHARGGWDATRGVYTRWPARGVVQVNGFVIVGDYQTGDLYTLDPSTYDDAGQPLIATRRIPYLSNDPAAWMFLDQIELACQVGVGTSTGQGVSPVVTLRVSRDAGQTWVSAGIASVGAIGDYLARCIWRRLGRVRADRLVLEFTQSDPVRRAWLGLSMRSTPGLGQA